MAVQQMINEILVFSAKLKSAVSDNQWDEATLIFQQRDTIIHQLLDSTNELSEQDTSQLREMIVGLQENDQVLIDSMRLQKNKLLNDVIDASLGQKAVNAYSKNI